MPNLILNAEYLITFRAAASPSALRGTDMFMTHKNKELFDQDNQKWQFTQ